MADIQLKPGHNIDNIRNTVTDYPKLWEWEGRFDTLPPAVKEIIKSDVLVLLMQEAELPGITIGDTTVSYKGAKMHFGTRMKLDGEVVLQFKEIKGATPESSWLVRKGMSKWLETIDSFFGDTKSTIQSTKTSLKVTMQDETGDSFYKVRYFGIKPTNISVLEVNYEEPKGDGSYPITEVTFSYDYWADQWDSNFGAE
jgi:hypothetical protein